MYAVPTGATSTTGLRKNHATLDPASYPRGYPHTLKYALMATHVSENWLVATWGQPPEKKRTWKKPIITMKDKPIL